VSQAAYRHSVATVLGLDPEIFEVPGTTVRSTDERRGTRLVSHYRVGAHSVLWCDPSVVGHAHDLARSSRPIESAELALWGDLVGAARVGSGFDHVVPLGTRLPRTAGAVAVLDPLHALDLVGELLASCSDDDRDEAEFDLEDLDPFLAGWIDDDRLLGLAGAREWTARPGFLDIGVIARPAVRGGGVGRAVVAEVASQAQLHGYSPLYRCNADNEASWRLCRGLGFEVAATIEAYEVPIAGER
jgi:GNAT superfamily N-acetyltransferase